MRTIVLAAAAVAAAACSKPPDPRKQCEKIMRDLVRGLAAGFGEKLDEAEAAEVDAKMKSEVERCMTWTPQQRRCFQTMEDSPVCEEAYAAMLGLKVSKVAAVGPPPAWTATLELPADDDGDAGSIYALEAAGDTAIALTDRHLIGVADGAERWRADRADATEIVPGPCVAVIAPENLRCLDPASGAVRWQTPPVPANTARYVTGAWRGDRLVVVAQDGAVVIVDPAACTGEPASARCVAAAPTIGLRVASDDPHVVMTPSGAWYYADDGTIVAIGADDLVVAQVALDGDAYITRPAVTPGGAAVFGLGPSVYRFDPAACGRELVARADAPPGCVAPLADRAGEEADPGDVIAVGEDGAAFTLGNELHVWRAGKKAWAAEISFALQITGGDPVAVTGGSQIGGVDLPVEVREVALSDGTTRWRTEVPSVGSTGFSGPSVAFSERWVFVASRTAVAAVPRTR